VNKARRGDGDYTQHPYHTLLRDESISHDMRYGSFGTACCLKMPPNVARGEHVRMQVDGLVGVPTVQEQPAKSFRSNSSKVLEPPPAL
jgi:hypothetical protein